MKTYIFIALLFAGLSVYADDGGAPVAPFSNAWPSDAPVLRSAQSNPFDFPDNPDPDPVPLGDNMGWMLILGGIYVGLKYVRSGRFNHKHH